MRRWSLGSLIHDYLTPPTLLRLVPISIVLITGVVLTTWTHRLLSNHRDLVVHTHEVIEMAKDVLIGLDDAETGERGYLLSNDRRYLAPYGHARERLAWMAPALNGLVVDNADQVARVAQLRGLIGTKLDELQAAIDTHDAKGSGAAIAMELVNLERATMDAIRHEIGQITEGEKALLRLRDAEVRSDEHRVQLVAILVGLASLLTRTAVELYLARKEKRSRKTGQGCGVAISPPVDPVGADLNGTTQPKALPAERNSAVLPMPIEAVPSEPRDLISS